MKNIVVSVPISSNLFWMTSMSNEFILKINCQCSIYWGHCLHLSHLLFLILTIPVPSFVLNSEIFFISWFRYYLELFTLFSVHSFCFNPLVSITSFNIFRTQWRLMITWISIRKSKNINRMTSESLIMFDFSW